MSNKFIKKILIVLFFVFCFSASCLVTSSSLASDFIAPNSGDEPIVIDVSNLNLLSEIDVSIGNFSNQPRPYRDENTKSLVIFPPPISSSEQTIQVRSGSSVVTKTISFRPSPGGVLRNSLLPDLQKARGGNSITKISDGRIVLIGGSNTLATNPTSTIEIFNPETGKSEYLKSLEGLKNTKLQIPRSQHSATYLGISELPKGMIIGPVEQILVAGGFSEKGLLKRTLEIVEIQVGTTQAVSTLLSGKNSKLKRARIFHTVSLLPDGRVLILGGQGRISMSSLGALNSIEIFDPQTKTISQAEISLNISRLLHTATTLQNGNILISGGFTNEKQDEFGLGPATSTNEVIDVTSLSIKKVGSFVGDEGLGGHSATLLTNGFVLVTGGSTDFFSAKTKDELKGLTTGRIQVFDPNSETFNTVTNNSGGNLELQTSRFLHKSVLLPNGNVIVVGGLNIKSALSSTSLISTPISTIEIIEPNLLTASGTSFMAEQKEKIDTSIGRILPTVVLVTPKNKTQGFLSTSDSNTFVNSAVYITGGYTNGSGALPTKVSELIQIESNNTIEGRRLNLKPGALIRGGFLSELLVELDQFSKVPALKIEPQTVNLSVANNFMANVKVLSTGSDIFLLRAESIDSNGSIIVSPSLFEVGESISISKKDSSVQGEFEINFLPVDSSKDFLPAKVKVNVSDSSKPFLATVPGHGISLSTQEGNSTDMVQLKVLSQDGSTEFSSVPQDTKVTATILDSQIANLGGTGISSIVGTLATQFTINALKPGKTSLNFSIDFPDVLSVSIPLEVSGSPSFTNIPVDTAVLANLAANKVEVSNVQKLNSSSIAFENLQISATSSLFPIYVPVNLQSSQDNSPLSGLVTLRPVFGVDLTTALPRTFLNKGGTEFKSPLETAPDGIAGIVPSDTVFKPIAVLASSDGIRTVTYDISVSENLGALNMINIVSGIKDLDLFESSSTGGDVQIAALKDEKLLIIDGQSGKEETSISLSGTGFEQELIEIDNQLASVVSVGDEGVDLIFPIIGSSSRIVNFKLSGNTKNISVVEKLSNGTDPLVVAYDGFDTLSVVNLLDVNAQIKEINTAGEKVSKIDYAGRFKVNGELTDVLIASTQRDILLFDLNKLTNIPVNDDLKIKNKIEDLLVIDGIAYLALGKKGVLALSIGALIDSIDETPAKIVQFKKNKLTVVKSSGIETIILKSLHANKLASSKPFLLVSGEDNNLTVIRVSP